MNAFIPCSLQSPHIAKSFRSQYDSKVLTGVVGCVSAWYAEDRGFSPHGTDCARNDLKKCGKAVKRQQNNNFPVQPGSCKEVSIAIMFLYTFLQVEPRYFHTAVGFDDYMAIVGGYTQHRNTSEKILIYKFRCNYWYTLDLSGELI